MNSNFLAELLIRLFSDKPWFFKVIQYVTLVISIVMLLPKLVEALTGNGFALPATWTDLITTAVGWAAFAAGFIAQLTMKTADKNEKKLE